MATGETGGVSAVIVAAGSSERMGAGRSKLLLELAGKTVIRRCLEAFQQADCIFEIVLVAREQDLPLMEQQARGIEKLAKIVPGGADRQESVHCGVLAAAGELVAIHDGARPLVTGEEIAAVCRDGARTGAATLCCPAKDTVKVAGEDGFVASTPRRESLRLIATPQVFRKSEYLAAYEKAANEGLSFTDDCQLIEHGGGRVFLTPGAYTNLKITTPEDLLLAEALCGGKTHPEQGGGSKTMRIGHGYDVHRLESGRKLILGGVEIPFPLGLQGHSDADVLLHAVADSLLGAAALGDIGKLFPDTDPRYEGADSREFLRAVAELIASKGYRVGNIDATVIAQRPKLSPYTEAMRQTIAAACRVEPEKISIKATTEEGLGFTGRGEGIAAHAVCLLTSAE